MIPKPIEPPAQALLQRLDAGYARIDAAPETDPPAWENFWLDLLRDYEEVCAELSRTDETPNDEKEDAA